MDDTRIIELETKITFFEQTVQELNEVVYNQQKQIDALEKTSKDLIGQIKGMSEPSGSNAPADDKPPHY